MRGRRSVPGGLRQHDRPSHIIGKQRAQRQLAGGRDRKSTRLNSSHSQISYAAFCLKTKQLSNMTISRPRFDTPCWPLATVVAEGASAASALGVTLNPVNVVIVTLYPGGPGSNPHAL